MTAETPRVGDVVRMTRVDPDVTTTVTGQAKPAGRWGDPGCVYVGPYRCHPPTPGWTVDVIERALPPEPPIGSIVAAPDDIPAMRYADGLWRYEPNGKAWTWGAVSGRAVVLREGWGT